MAAKKKRAPRRVAAGPKSALIEIPGTSTSMQARVGTFEDVPKARPFVFPPEQVEEIAIGVNLGLNICLTGPTGCGKTALPTALAAQLNTPMVRFNMDGETRVSHLRGMQRPVAEDGVLTLRFSVGAMVHAMQRAYWVLCDEIDAALPSVLMVLQPTLEEGNRSMYIPETGERIVAEPGFQLFATGNTIGYRAMSRARHAGTNPLNDAFIDRFGMVIACDYPGQEEEAQRISVNCPHVNKLYIQGIARCAHEMRKDENFRADFSTRRCVQWARLTQEFHGDPKGVLRAAELAVIRKLTSPTDAKVCREVIQRVLGYGKG